MSIGRLQLSWRPPADTGGRSDITYAVVCERCEGRACQPCGEKVRFDPSNTDLKETRVTVSELEPHLNYTFTVEARSRVSQFSNKKATSNINTALHYTGQCSTDHGSRKQSGQFNRFTNWLKKKDFVFIFFCRSKIWDQ